VIRAGSEQEDIMKLKLRCLCSKEGQGITEYGIDLGIISVIGFVANLFF
jgi:hypothetical protein